VTQERMARRLLAGAWRDLSDELEVDQGGDNVLFSSRRREILEELVKRAADAGHV
jgi:hypothetical protein